jgi:glycosyltransferase involved in cell wall biosynthesis
MSGQLSVCILACNEESSLARCLDAVAFADEVIVVVDRKSRDASEKLARERADRVEVRPYEGDLEQKSYCVSLATCDWVLIVDPDEVVSRELGEAIVDVIGADGRGCSGFDLDRKTYHLGRWIEHGDFYPDWTLRLFRRDRATWTGINPHGRIVVDGRVGRLSGTLEHFSYRDLTDQVERIQFFSGESAKALQLSGQHFSLSRLILRPPARFTRAYFLKLGFLDGLPGFVIAAATAFHVFLKYAKLWELERAARSPAPKSGATNR